MSHTTEPSKPHTNRLIHEKSPYLLQHAHNPVDWHPWDTEALETARTQDKPIFLSVGYSACHWCHVMERESFENEAIAAILNTHFVSIKVDREERPDVDEIYMTAVQMISGHGGWPMSVFLTPDGRPFYGGTYFPPEQRQGRIGFASLLNQLATAFQNRREEVEQVADNIVEDLQQATRQKPVSASLSSINPQELLINAVADMVTRFDSVNGGFGQAPKFPPHHALRLLTEAIPHYETSHPGNPGDMPRLLLKTLDKMALGGIYDHIGGGFHRYATDAIWFLPHFEKMLSDNALLARVYATAYQITGKEAYARIARETCDWVLRDMTDAEGGFHAALDADSEGEEGKYYVWTQDEITGVVGAEQGADFARQYQVIAEGNYREEATGHKTGNNILCLAIGMSPIELPDTLPAETLEARAALLESRYKRVPPGKDDKVITGWNGLMIGALAHTGAILNEVRYIEAARRAADFCLTILKPEGGLLRRYARGEAGLAAFLDDYAYLADGLLDLFAATGETRWAVQAAALADTLLERFWDEDESGFFFAGSGHEQLIAQSKDLFDGALPSANGVAARVLVRLSNLSVDGINSILYRNHAETMLNTYHGVLQRAPHGTATLILAALEAFPEAVPMREFASLVTLTAETPETLVLKPGEKADALFHLQIASGYHVNSRKPADSNLIPTIATITTDLPAAVGAVAYPPVVVWTQGDESLPTYQGNAPFVIPVAVAADAEPGRYTLTLSVRYQPCSDSECLAPEEKSATVFAEIAL